MPMGQLDRDLKPMSAMNTMVTSWMESTKIEADALSDEEVKNRKMKGLKVNDRFQDLLRSRPGKLL